MHNLNRIGRTLVTSCRFFMGFSPKSRYYLFHNLKEGQITSKSWPNSATSKQLVIWQHLAILGSTSTSAADLPAEEDWPVLSHAKSHMFKSVNAKLAKKIVFIILSPQSVT